MEKLVDPRIVVAVAIGVAVAAVVADTGAANVFIFQDYDGWRSMQNARALAAMERSSAFHPAGS
jgi:hypothetical protein